MRPFAKTSPCNKVCGEWNPPPTNRIGGPLIIRFSRYKSSGAQRFIDPLHPATRDSRGKPLHLVWRRPLRERHDRVPVSELWPREDRTVRAVPRSIGGVSLSGLFVHRPVRCGMGSVAVTFRIMPEDADTDLESIRSRVRATLGGALRDLREQPVAFGLKAILAVAIVRDASGGSDLFEQSLAAIPGDRKSTRLNSSHLVISYAVFCLKKKNNITNEPHKTSYAATTLWLSATL